ncbi:SET domain-containing protein [Lentinus tigrinus ALCF2SS1-7]|uniref:SET domain-containing protein n=1 Tax=Lentinus tigrinus ALCF2SS1-6 TaxID=1328759 RepID=A0A5C2SQY4_9APHY|nr:SET domain-containing protein [Lentinus tigrinus ALCF2SS1-6]RPD80005.1 SET domain-containing protein [Lentinus tigrinus ALCF2SS1-7]
MERPRWERLLRWLSEEHGMDVGERAFHVKARDVPGAGRGLFASRDCPPSTTLFKVPSTALMNKTTIAKLYPQLRERRLSGVQLVSMHIFLHKPPKEEESRDPVFGSYISTLPRDFSSHPLTWLVKRDIKEGDAWERAALSVLPPSTVQKLSVLQERFLADWQAVGYVLEDSTIIATSSRTDISPAISPSNGLTMDYLWAWLNVNTRCIFYRIQPTLSHPDNFTLCPVLDFANHSSGHTHIFPVVDSDVWGGVAKKPPKYFIFFSPSQETIQQGQQLYLQYGMHPNTFLFSEYGFVNDVPQGAIKSGAYAGEVDVQEPVEELFAQHVLGPRLKAVLTDESYWGDWTIHAAPTPAHPSYRLMAALRLLHAFDDVTEIGQAAFDSTVDQWREVIYGQTDKISLQNEKRWRASLYRICSRVAERARTRLTRVSTAECTDEDGSWRRWMHSNISILWKEELEVAEAVVASLKADAEF